MTSDNGPAAESSGISAESARQSAFADTLAILTDTDLTRAERRAWYSAARSWSEYRALDTSATEWLRDTLQTSALQDEAYWRALHTARKARRIDAAGIPWYQDTAPSTL